MCVWLGWGRFGCGIKMSEHAKLLFMQKKIKQEIGRNRANNNNEELHTQVGSRGLLACWSCCWSIRDWQAAGRVLTHAGNPTDVCVCVCVSPPSPTLSAKSKKVTVAVNSTFYTLRLLAFFLAGRELHRGEVNVYRHNTMTVYQRWYESVK